MAKAVANLRIIREVFQVVPHLRRLPSRHFWIDYDEEADVLYLSFERPQHATESILTQDNVLLRYRGKNSSASPLSGRRRHA